MKKFIFVALSVFLAHNTYANLKEEVEVYRPCIVPPVKPGTPIAEGSMTMFGPCTYKNVEGDAEGLFVSFDCGKEKNKKCYVPSDAKGYKDIKSKSVWYALDFTKIIVTKSEETGRSVVTKRYKDGRFEGWGAGNCVSFQTKGLGLYEVATGKMKDPIKDNVDLPFVDQPEVIGVWQSVDFVDTENLFNPNKKLFKADLTLKEIKFLKKGKTEKPFWTWTKGVLIHKVDQTASAYKIKNIGGKDYMFLEWKSGDYVWDHMKPKYYVMEKVVKASSAKTKTKDTKKI